MGAISPASVEALLAQLDPWLALLSAQIGEETDFGAELCTELASHSKLFATECQQLQLRGLANCYMLLVRGLESYVQKTRAGLSEQDITQLMLWVSSVQSYLRKELRDSRYVLSDLTELVWVPKLSADMQMAITQRLQEGLAFLPQAESPAMSAQLDSTVATDLGTVEIGEVGYEVIELAAAPSAEFNVDNATTTTQAPYGDWLGAAEGSPLGANDFLTKSSSEAPDRNWSDRSDSHGHVEANAPLASEFAFAANGAPIWIASEEFQLVTETVQSRLLPALTSLASQPEAIAENYSESCYQIELLGNAFEVLSLPNASQMTSVLLHALQAPGAGAEAIVLARAPELLNWVVALVDFCSRPESVEAREEVVAIVASPAWIAPLSEAQVQAFSAEIVSIRVGLDPSLRATRKSEISAEDMTLTPAADVMHNVLQGMLMELPENAQNLSESIAEYVRSGDPEAIDQARRVAHTLKGDANTVGIHGIATLTHVLEDIFIEVAKNPGIPDAAFANLMIEASDCVSEMADFVLARGEAPVDSISVAQRLLSVANQLLDGESTLQIDPATDAPVATAAETREQATGASDQALMQALAATIAAVPMGGKSVDVPRGATDVPMLQIPADVLDRLLDFSSEALVLLRQIENQVRAVDEGQIEIGRQRQQSVNYLADLDKIVSFRGTALQSARAKGEVDPLELDQYNELYQVSRRLVEASADEQTAKISIESASRRLLDLTNDQEKVQLELQDQLMRTRQVPVKEFVGRFQRAVRQTAKMLDKDVELIVNGQDTMIDRLQMENLIDPLMHALRNAVDHGIEQQSMRMTRGKPLVGKVTLSFSRDAQFITVLLSDDGAGLNFERIRAKAISRGLLDSDDSISEEDLAQVILLPGFSTKEEVSQVSGRGIGLDVVYQRIQDLRGSLQIVSTQGGGTRIDIRLPTSTSSQYAALTQIGPNNWVAIATDTVESFQLIEPADCLVVGDSLKWRFEGQLLALSDLSALVLGQRTSASIPTRAMTGLVIRMASGEMQVGMLPDVFEMRTVITKDFGPYMRSFPGTRGATILGSGDVAPVVDARELIRSVSAYQPWSMRDEQYRQELAKVIRKRVIVADDSLSVRRALGQLLSDAGFQVELARDGLEALTLAKANLPDIMLIDLEMPRMNGLELASHLRFQQGVTHMPILMITSRAGAKHLQTASESGINEVIAKPYQDDALLSLIAAYLDKAEALVGG